MMNLSHYDEDFNRSKMRPEVAARFKGKVYWGEDLTDQLDKSQKKEEKKIKIELKKLELGECGYKLCSKPANHRCSNCLHIAYCSTECSRAEWEDHRKDCFKVFEM